MATRGPLVESRHRVHAAVVHAAGGMRAVAGDPATVSCWRSCAKPLQVMPFLASGHFDRLGWGTEELALACASHGGEPEHVAIAAAMLRDIGLEEGDLACGAHEPLTRRGVRLAQESGEPVTRLHNNCSGKHAAMLALARGEQWPVRGYEQSVHPVQSAILKTIAEWTGIAAERIEQVIDGCGVVAFGLPLESMALAFSRLAADACGGGELSSRIFGAMRAHPFLIGGTDRFDTVLLEESGGRVIAKVGAEGVHSVAIPEESLGLAVKVEDGSARAQYPAVLNLLQRLSVLPEQLSPRLERFLHTPLHNTRGAVVGEIRSAFEIRVTGPPFAERR
ncbi:MAG: asparaginase [Gemmatimonadota bacterium]|nr:asparaginase [Gemmatimonadota bacterium]